MPWEQFEMKELDGRLQLIAGYLGPRLFGNHVLDLNCGTAPLLEWLPEPHTWGWYYGNDTCEDFVLQARERERRNTTFRCLPDDEVLEDLVENCVYPDILLCLGYAARLNDWESKTLDQTVRDVIVAYDPEIVILEFWHGIYERRNLGVPELIGWIQKYGYDTSYRWALQAAMCSTGYASRDILIFENNKCLS